ncbi:MAG: hypothetical protein B6D61_04550 [Bacteroidetes bacterium 4484_249]|nr:MAG: hypothetical protein B6D61_04550 [Bacteroidetes bacterium 4484_249]
MFLYKSKDYSKMKYKISRKEAEALRFDLKKLLLLNAFHSKIKYFLQLFIIVYSLRLSVFA